jgi:carbon storage regulator
MLILQRKAGQAIMIGDDIEIVVLEVSGDNVRLGIDAPRAIRVLRHELLEELSAENRRAAEVTATPSSPSLAPLLGALRGQP